MQKNRQKKSIQKQDQKNKNEKHVIYLEPEKFKYHERLKAAKLKIVKEAAKTGDLIKLDDLKNFDEDEIIIPYEPFADFYLMARRFKTISEELEYYIEHHKLQGIMPEWKKTRTMDISRWVTKDRLKAYEKMNWTFEHEFEFEFDSWDEYYKRENEFVETFIKTGEFEGLEYMPIEDFVDEEGVFNILKKSFDLYIKLFDNYKCSNDIEDFITSLLDETLPVYEQFYHLDGRLSYKDKLRKSKSNSGKGQQEAQAKRVLNLVEKLKKYIDKGSNTITIGKEKFYQFVNETFIGREFYPRHYAIYKDYQKRAEHILKKEIVLTRNKIA
jgi:hypothetical protein